MKPYPLRNLPHEKKIFNYHLSGSRTIQENAFEILARRVRIFLSPVYVAPENVEKVTLASCVIHSFLCEKALAYCNPPGLFDRKDEHTGRVIEENWRSDMNGNNRMIAAELRESNNYPGHCKNIRDNFYLYSIISGKVPWQDKFV